MEPFSSGFTIAELCASKVWPKRDFGILKARAVAEYAQRVPPTDVLIFSDSDVLFNSAASPKDVLHRFHNARGSARVVFMAEPWCFAPTMQTVTRRSGAARQIEAISCTKAKLAQYERADSSHAQRHWRCPRFLNSGLYAGFASEVATLGELWAQPALWLDGCQPRPMWGYADQCIATEIMLLGNVSIALDVHEALFASGGTAVAPPPIRSRHANSTGCTKCGRTACHCSLLNEWRIPDQRRPRRPSPKDGRAGALPLQRSADYRSSCAIADAGPLIIHFNGVSKKLAKTAEMRAWIDASFPL